MVARSDGESPSVLGGRSVVGGGSVEDEVYKKAGRKLAVSKCSQDRGILRCPDFRDLKLLSNKCHCPN